MYPKPSVPVLPEQHALVLERLGDGDLDLVKLVDVPARPARMEYRFARTRVQGGMVFFSPF